MCLRARSGSGFYPFSSVSQMTKTLSHDPGLTAREAGKCGGARGYLMGIHSVFCDPRFRSPGFILQATGSHKAWGGRRGRGVK